jgi:hypothetical protein
MKTRFLAAMALVLVAGCATDESADFLTVGNDTNSAIAVFAFPDGALVDLVTHLPPGSYDENLILSGHSLGFATVPGYQAGKGVFLAIYVVQRQGADLTITRTVSDGELEFFRGHVTIDTLPTCRITDFCATHEGTLVP